MPISAYSSNNSFQNGIWMLIMYDNILDDDDDEDDEEDEGWWN